MHEQQNLPGDAVEPSPPDDLVLVPRAELEALRKLAASAAEGATAAGVLAEVPLAAHGGPAESGHRRLRLADAEEARTPPTDDSRVARELAARERKLSELESAYLGAVRDRELATALAGRPLVAGAAAQLVKLWRDEFEAYEEGGLFKVATRDGRPVAQVVGEWLGTPEFAHFCLPTSRGGVGGKEVNRPSAVPAAPAPRNLGEAVVMRWREASAARPDNLLKPIGLRRHR
jgi:hypothetical protein